MYDWLAKKSLRAGYFLWTIIAYGLGLLITYVALNLMDGHGQPALLYIVPLTLGTISVLGKKRGELKTLWSTGNLKDSALICIRKCLKNLLWLNVQVQLRLLAHSVVKSLTIVKFCFLAYVIRSCA